MAAAVLNKQLFEGEAPPLAALYADEAGVQHPELQLLARKYLRREFEELQKLVDYMPFDFALIPKHRVPAPRLGAGGEVAGLLLTRFAELGGTLLDGRVTHLAVRDGACHGLQYERDGSPHRLACSTLVIASGGFSGLLPDSATPNIGSLHGMFLQSGGVLSNLEFSYRFALGDLSGKRVLYPPDTEGARLYRNGAVAQWLERACAELPRERRDIEIFQRYWVHNLEVEHSLARGETSYRIGPIRGLSMGGIAHSWGATQIENLYVTGEASHQVSADCIVGLPWASYIAASGKLSDTLSERPTSGRSEDFALLPSSAEVEPALLAQVQQRLAAFQDHRFSEAAAQAFIDWCQATRRVLAKERAGCLQTLILAEAFTASVMSRRESYGYFFRGDFPVADPKLFGTVSTARYDAREDRVEVQLVPHASRGLGSEGSA
jgi:L-aspartate oxidase